MAEALLYLSSLIRSPMLDRAGERLGRVADVIVRLDAGGLPPVTGLVGRIGGRELFVPTDRIASLEADAVRLSGEMLSLVRFERRAGEVLLRKDILGRRLIDVNKAQLVTAQEIVLARIDGWWRVVGIDPRPRTRLRRLLPRMGHPGPEDPVLPWSELEPFVGHVPSSRLRIRNRRLARLHPAQIADPVEEASHDEGGEIIEAVGTTDRELEADVFEELDDEHQVEFINERSDAQAAQLIARMAADDAADLIAEIDQDRRLAVLERLPLKQRRKVRTLLGYNPGTAGGLMSPEFVAVEEQANARDALERVRSADVAPEAALTVYVVDDQGRPRGSVLVVALLRAEGDQPLSELAERDLQSVRTDEELPEIARLMSDFNLTMLPVVDEAEKLVGVVTVDDVLEALVPEDWRRRSRVAQR